MLGALVESVAAASVSAVASGDDVKKDVTADQARATKCNYVWRAWVRRMRVFSPCTEVTCLIIEGGVRRALC